jgi:transposase
VDDRARHPARALVAQKKTLTASDRDPLDRAAFQVLIADQDATDLVIVDEFGTNTDMPRRYARAPVGERAYGSIPRTTPPNLTVIAAMTLPGIGPRLLLPGGTDTAACDASITHILAPALRPGPIVIVDTLRAHTAPRIAERLAEHGCRRWCVPAYSPDVSPIDLAFAKIKTLLRTIGARTREALEAAIATVLDQISAADAASFFRHCGYWIPSAMAQAFRS